MNIDDLLAEIDTAMSGTTSSTLSSRTQTTTMARNLAKPPPPQAVTQPPATIPSRQTSVVSNVSVQPTISVPSSTSASRRPMDDIDSLLMDADSLTSDILGNSFYKSNKPASCTPTSAPAVASQLSTPAHGPSVSVLPGTTLPRSTLGFSSAATSTSTSSSSFGAFGMSSACRPLLLFGKQPRQTSALAATCSHIRCVQCSHEVICIPGHRWGNADYFFFRNAVPDVAALMRRTIPDGLASAYCCQCAWMTVVDTVNITQAQAFGRKPYRQECEATPEQVKWVCSKYG